MDNKTLIIVEKAKSCNQEAVHILLKQSRGLILSIMNEEPPLTNIYDYEDFFQILFLKVGKVKGQENPRHSEKFFGWLKSVAKNEKLNIIREEFYRNPISINSLPQESLIDPSDNPEEMRIAKEKCLLIWKILKEFFTKNEADIIAFSYLGEERYTIKEIITILKLDCSVEQFCRMRKNLLRKFRMILETMW